MFDVVLNSNHVVASNLDIFSRVGRGVAHDEVIPFTVNDGVFEVFGETSDFDGTLVVEFRRVCVYVYVAMVTNKGMYVL